MISEAFIVKVTLLFGGKVRKGSDRRESTLLIGS